MDSRPTFFVSRRRSIAALAVLVAIFEIWMVIDHLLENVRVNPNVLGHEARGVLALLMALATIGGLLVALARRQPSGLSEALLAGAMVALALLGLKYTSLGKTLNDPWTYVPITVGVGALLLGACLVGLDLLQARRRQI